MLRLLFGLISSASLVVAVNAGPLGGTSPVQPKYFQVGQLVKCSYKGRFESTKTVECQLRAGLDSNNLWKFSAAENHWSGLEKNAGQQIMLGYRKGGIKHMEADFAMLNQKNISNNPPRPTQCTIESPNDSYSVGFRVARILSAEDDGDVWKVTSQLGGNGNLEAWEFEIDQQENPACHKKFLELMADGQSHTFYYHQESKNDDYKIWRVD